MSFLSEAANYDARVAEELVESLLFTAAKFPYTLRFNTRTPRYVAIYSDANHSLKSLRGYWGCVVQLQSSDEPEPQSNVVHWTGGRLARLYDSVYVAELKASMNAIVEFIKIGDTVAAIAGELPVVFFSDNKAMVQTLNSTKETHPFASEYADFCRTKMRELNITVKWCASQENHADKLTKPSKWW